MVGVLLLTGSTYTQELNLRHYDTRSGLSSSETYRCLQDHHGYIWFLSDAGVCRFDGVKFRKYTVRDGLCDNTVFQAFEDRHHRIWFGTFSGGVCYYYQDTIHSIAGNDEMMSLTRHGQWLINSIFVDKGDTLWIGYTSGNGLVKIAPDDNYKHPVLITSAPGLRTIWCMEGASLPPQFSNSGSAVTSYLLRSGGREFMIPLHPDNRPIVDSRVQAFCREDGRIVFSYFDFVYFFYKDRIVSTKRMPSEVTSLYIDSRNALWVGLRNRGIFCFPDLNMDAAPVTFLEGVSVGGVIEDREGGYWICTLDDGVYYAPSFLVRHLEVTSSDGERPVACMYAERDMLYVGTVDGAVISYEVPQDVRTTIVPESAFQFETHFIYNIVPCNDQLLLMGSRPAIYSRQGRFIRLVADDDHPGLTLKSVVQLDDNNWMGCAPGVIVQFRIPGGVLKWLRTPVRVNVVHQDHNKRIWLGAQNGLWELRDTVFHYWGDRYPLLRFRIDDMLEDKKGNLWLATRGGGVLMISDNDYLWLSQGQGLISNNCTSIEEDRYGRIWVGTFDGLSRVEYKGRDKVRIENYDSYNGLITNEIRTVKCSDHHVFIGSNQGVDYFPLDYSPANRVAPKIILEQWMVNDRVVSSTATQHFLKSGKKNMEFTFTGISMQSADRIRYRYILAGYDPDWQYTSNHNVQYTNLPPGHYRFVVQAINSNGVYSEGSATVDFFIATPWWRRTGFVALIVTAGLALCYMGIYVYVNRIRKKEREATRINKMLAESRMMSLRAQMNPHFIFNAINSIQHFVLMNEKDMAYDYLARFSKLIRMVLDGARFSQISLDREAEILRLYVELENLRFEQPFVFQLNIQSEWPQEQVFIPHMIIQPYVENAILHGLFPKKAQGRLEVSLLQQGRSVLVTITDNGIGREQSRIMKAGSSHTSTGMSITAERLKEIAQLTQTEVQTTITDLTDEQGRPAGTQVQIKIPLV